MARMKTNNEAEIMQGFNFVKTFENSDCSEFDIFDGNEKIGYYIKHLVHPIDNVVLDSPVFEMYYDFDEEFEEFTGLIVADSLEECLEEFWN